MMRCNLCNSNEVVFLFNAQNIHGRHLLDKKKAFRIFRCSKCESIFVSGVEINDQYYKKYYPRGYYNENYDSKKPLSWILDFLVRFSFKKKRDLILKNVQLVDKKWKILDIGCGNGAFLSKLDSSKVERYGIEINKDGYETCLSKGLRVYNQELTGIDFQDKKFDVVTLWHVLEHIEKPRELLNKIYQILKEDGILAFITPNTDSFGFRWGKENWFHLDAPRHLILYNQKNVSWLLGKSGFKIIGMKNEFYDFPLDLFWSLRKSTMRFLVYPLYPVFKFFSREHLTFVCKKYKGKLI